MPQSRRSFLATLGAGVLSAACARRVAVDDTTRATNADATSAGAPGAAGAAARGHALGLPIGIQLYTVRRELQRDYEGTLARLAEMGYREVEFAGYFGHAPAETRAILARHGLTAPSTHVPYDATEGDRWPRALDEANAVGHRWVTIPWLAESLRTPDGYRRVAERLTSAATAAKAAGLRLAYHNHDFELEPLPDGTLPLELLLRGTDPALVDFELDVYWLVRAGGDPMAWIGDHPHRFTMLHVKDTAGPPEHRMVDVGRGTIDWKALFHDIFLRRGRPSVEHLFVEHDQPADPMAFARASHDYLAALRL